MNIKNNRKKPVLQEERRIKQILEKERKDRAAEVRKTQLEYKGEDFEFACANYGIPMFDESWASTEWEVKFLCDIKDLMLNKKVLSKNQLQTLRNVTRKHLDNTPTEKQLQYLKDLGCEDFEGTKKEASKKIDELLKSRSE